MVLSEALDDKAIDILIELALEIISTSMREVEGHQEVFFRRVPEGNRYGI